MRYNRLHNNGKGDIQLGDIRQLRQVLLNDNASSDQLIRHLLLIQIALPIKTEDLIQLRWEHVFANDPSIIIYSNRRGNSSLKPCFFPVTGEILSYLNGLGQQHNNAIFVFDTLAQMDARQRNRLVSDYIKKSRIRLSIDLKYLHRFFCEYACKSYFIPKFVTSFMSGENTVAYSQKLARNALILWWGEQIDAFPILFRGSLEWQ